MASNFLLTLTQENEEKQSNWGSAASQAVKFCVSLLAAIYLAKRNIRKKGILELHEQVGTSAAAAALRRVRASFTVLRCRFPSSGAVQPPAQVDES